MTTWIDTIAFPDSWVDLRRRRDRMKHRKMLASMRKELRRELAPEHELSKVRWSIIGAGAPARDDVLLRLRDGSLAITHLTWKRGQERLPWPSTVRVLNLDDFRAELVERGHDVA